MRKSSGFTIVELIIVMIVIAIIATISASSMSAFQARARDNQRNSRTTMIAEALESYYDKNGEYPDCTAMTGSISDVTTNTLKGLSPDILTAPKATAGTNSVICTDIDGNQTNDIYAYVINNGQWQLKYREEGSGNIKIISSRRKTNEQNPIGTLFIRPNGTILMYKYNLATNTLSRMSERNSLFSTQDSVMTTANNSLYYINNVQDNPVGAELYVFHDNAWSAPQFNNGGFYQAKIDSDNSGNIYAYAFGNQLYKIGKDNSITDLSDISLKPEALGGIRIYAVINNRIYYDYLVSGHFSLYEYNFTTGIKTPKTYFSEIPIPEGCTDDGTRYIYCNRNGSDLMRYDISNDSWSDLGDFAYNRSNLVYLRGKLYSLKGDSSCTYSGNKALYVTDLSRINAGSSPEANTTLVSQTCVPASVSDWAMVGL